MKYSIYWINPHSHDYVESELSANHKVDGGIVAAGWYATVVLEQSQGMALWRCKQGGFKPLRMAMRDDGNGITERTARIRTAGKEMSSSDDSNRLTHQGRGNYR